MSLGQNPTPSKNVPTKRDLPIFEKWANSIIAPSDPLSTVNLDRFGLKNSVQVMAFLQSPAGKELKAEIAIQLANELALEKNIQFQMQEQANAENRLRSFIFLALLEKAANAEKIQEETESLQQNKERLDRTSPASSSPHYGPQLPFEIAAYTDLISNATSQLEQSIFEGTALADRMDALVNIGINQAVKYEIYQTSLDDIPVNSDKLPKSEIESLMQKIDDEMDQIADKISMLIADDKDAEAEAIKHQHNGLWLKRASYQTILEVMLGVPQKVYVTFDDKTGKYIETKSHKDADFILESGLQLVKKGSQLYLLRQGQELDSTNEKEAKSNYEDKKNSIMSVKSLVANNKVIETKDHEGRVTDLKHKIETNDKQTTAIAAQREVLQAALTNAQNTLQPNAPKPIPVKNPVLSRQGSSTGTSTIATFTLQMVKLHKDVDDGRDIPIDELIAIRNQAPKPTQKYFNDMLGYKNTAMEFKNRIAPASPIPNIKMQTFLRNLAYLGVDPTKPAITALLSPTDLRALAAKQPQNKKPEALVTPANAAPLHEKEPYTAPTPFKDPYR